MSTRAPAQEGRHMSPRTHIAFIAPTGQHVRGRTMSTETRAVSAAFAALTGPQLEAAR
jgi:hypothetical protein